MKRLAVFDLDGTLHHTEFALAPAIARAASDITGEAEPPYSLVNSLYGEPLEVFCKVLAGSDEPAVCKRFFESVQFHQAVTLPTKGKLYPGVKQMLCDLQALGFDLAILSNAHMDYIVLVTETLGIVDNFTMLTGRTDEASKTARLFEMSRGYDFTVMVGDRYHDIQAGLENTLPVIACSYGYGTDSEYQGAIRVDSVKKIVPVIEEMITR
ncbi:MAG: HAD family hydrolase [Candidatus Sabulitectum sp.]|nr:HAD family hydrolase [Candidatus Sabulitectum sp.]